MSFSLNSQQLVAVTAPLDKAARILSGPGAGKTTVITNRIKFLLDNGVDPKSIIAVTFSKNMADDLFQRTLKVAPEVAGSPLEKRICTIHALTFRILKAEGDRRQVAKEWQIKKAIEEAAEQLDFAEGWAAIYYWINAAKAEMVRSGQDEQWYREMLSNRGVSVQHAWKMAEIRRLFDRKMKRENLITFPDMLYCVEVLFADNDKVCVKWQNNIEYVLVDEGQDTSGQAMRILSTLAAPQNRMYIVGDADQTLYKFAGATPEVNLANGFESRYPDGLTFKLETNYRSTQTIVSAINSLITNNYNESNEHLRKTLVTRPDAPVGEPISYQWFETAYDEAESIINNVAVELQNGRGPGDYFIGARTRAQLAWLEGPLVRAKIPFVNLAGGSFWASKHVADVVAYAKLVLDKDDKDAFQRAYNIASIWMEQPFDVTKDNKVIKHKGEYCSHRWLGRAFIDQCGGYYKGMFKVLKAKNGWRFKSGIEDLEDLMYHLDGFHEKPADLIQEIINVCYRDYLMDQEGITGGDEAENGKLEDLLTVVTVASQFNDLSTFLDSVDEMVKAAEAAKDKKLDDYLVISTAHRLKGQERNITIGIGISERLLPHRFSMEMPPQFGMLPTGDMASISDERDVMFVLVSRAREEVHLSGVANYRKDRLMPSRFITELGIELEMEG